MPVNPQNPQNPQQGPGQELDTGTGGFPVGQNDVRYTFDSGSDVGDESPKVIWSPGQINVDKQERDISRGTKSTLAAYLSDTTLGRTPSSPSPIRNKYPVNHVAGLDPDNLSLKDEKGFPTPPDNDLSGHLYKFTEGKNLESRSKAANNLKIKRGRQDGAENIPDGNDLLKDVTPITPAASSVGGKFSPEMGSVRIPDASPVKQYYGSPNLSNSVIYNRFNSENNEYQTVGAQLNSSQFAKKYELGTSQAVRDMSFGRLAQVGTILTTRASTEIGSFEPGYEPELISATPPGAAQLGLTKPSTSELTAESVIENLTANSIPEETLINVSGESWGTLNNVQDQFSGISNFGMQLLAVALLISLSVVVAAMTLIFTPGASDSKTIIVDKLGRKLYGASKISSSPSGYSIGSILQNIWLVLGIEPTRNPINRCLPVGAMSFFGISKTEITSAGMAAAAALNGLLAVSASPGYYSILGRMIGRSFLDVGASFANLGRAFNQGAFNGVSQIFNVVGVLRTSKFIKLINIFARIGDLTLDDKFPRDNEDLSSPGFGMRFNTRLDQMSSRDSLKGRMIDVGRGINPLTLSWASYRAPDLLIVPEGLRKVFQSNSAKKMGVHSIFPTIKGSDFPVAGAHKNGNPIYAAKNDESRIDTKEREKLEKLLESEYVPFYMHDVRTNEIISFHAFLASLSDEYSASYDTVESMGRAEPIKIYKSTQRKLGFSFYIASTSESDFDSMWLKINKLSTLVYPQFSKGKFVEKDNNKFHVPFSQMIQASPMIRVRIGDLIASNYSKFNLARVFGYSYSGTQFDGKTLPSAEETTSIPQEKYEEKLKQLKNQPGNFFRTNRQITTPAPLDATAANLNTGGSPVGMYMPKKLILQVVKSDNQGIHCKIVIPTGVDAEDLTENEKAELKSNYDNSEKATQKIIGRTYVFQESDLIPVLSTSEKLKDEASGEYSNAVKEFMVDDDEKRGNAIARSFRASGGKGLAGFIESMNFDWYDKVTWETDSGKKAPKICKVTISFSPIHDLTPGLDHMGANRAPIYRVGSY